VAEVTAAMREIYPFFFYDPEEASDVDFYYPFIYSYYYYQPIWEFGMSTMGCYRNSPRL